MSDILSRLYDKSEEKQREYARDVAWIALNVGFVSSKPRRFVSGICIHSAELFNDSEIIARGVQATLPIPLLWDHKPNTPIGKVTGIRVREQKFNEETPV